MREKITTTLAKAREMKNHIDQLVNKGKCAEANKERRQAELRLLRQRLSLEATKKISRVFLTLFETGTWGYTRIT